MAVGETKSPIILEDGKLRQLIKGEKLIGIDFQSGIRFIEQSEHYFICLNKEMRVRRFLRTDGILTTNGLLILD